MGKKQVVAVTLTILLMAVVSIFLLLLLSVLTYRMELAASAVRIAVKAIYPVSCLVGGIFIGKMLREKKYLWGLIAGGCYFVILLAGSMIAGGGAAPDVMELMIALVLTVPAGMVGGMIS